MSEGQTDTVDLNLLRRESAGKDKKITEYTQEMKTLREQLAEAQEAVVGKVAGDQAERQRMLELAAELKARSNDLEAKENALRTAIENRLPVNLVMRSVDDLDSVVEELKAFERQAVEQDKVRYVSKPTARTGMGEEPARITAEHLRRMKGDELSKIPDSVYARLMEGK